MLRPIMLLGAALLAGCNERSDAATRDFLDHAGKAVDAAGQLLQHSEALVAVSAAAQQVQQALAKATDSATAHKVRKELEAAAAQLQSAVGNLGDVRRLADDALAKAGTSRAALFASARQQLDRALADPQLRAAFEPVLEQLRHLLP